MIRVYNRSISYVDVWESLAQSVYRVTLGTKVAVGFNPINHYPLLNMEPPDGLLISTNPDEP